MYNHLANETSPYLQQHAKNPVDWYPWGKEALEKAKEENKLLLISIGYSACHWCHVMEEESFEDTAVARVMNEYFVNIKVDREERPDIDDVYMTACHLTSGGSCGWPLNSIALPDGKPVWAGTYFPKKRWLEILQYFIKAKQDEFDKLSDYANQIQEGIQQTESLQVPKSDDDWNTDIHEITDLGRRFLVKFDFEYGGIEGAPKFPIPNNYQMLLTLYDQTGDEKLLESTELILHQMASGGIYDQLGGGFARYSVDEQWKVPHFEKMLYDNAQLIGLYAKAYQLTKRPLYKQVITQSIEWAKRELLDSETGGFYSSLDADSEGEEGKFYIWSYDEIKELIPDTLQFNVLIDYYGISKRGNWEEEKNILLRTRSLEDLANIYNRSTSEIEQILQSANSILLNHRAQRIRPGTDDKVLTSWNGLMIHGLVDAYRAVQDSSYLTMAQNSYKFISNELSTDQKLLRTYKDGKAHISAFLDDYAHMIQAAMALYQITFEEDYLRDANRWMQTVQTHFLDVAFGLFYYTSAEDDPLIVRKKETLDNVIPSSNATMAQNLLTLGHLLGKEEYVRQAEKMCSVLKDEILKTAQPDFYSQWIKTFVSLSTPPYEIAIVGPEAHTVSHQMQKAFFSNALFLGGTEEGSLPLLEDKLVPGETTIYVCQNKVCKLPVTTIEEAFQQMTKAD